MDRGIPDPDCVGGVVPACGHGALAAPDAFASTKTASSVQAPVRSFYWWQQTLQEEDEVPVVFKTAESKVHDLMDFIVQSHSYDLPGVVVHRPMTANAKYLDWIDAETRRPSRR